MSFRKWWFEETHKMKVGDTIAYHCSGYVKAKISDWNKGKETVYFEGQLLELRYKVDWKCRKKLYKQRVFRISAKDDFIVIELWKGNLKLKKTLDDQLKKEIL